MLNIGYIWQYITFLRLYNKDKDIFKVKYEGEEGKSGRDLAMARLKNKIR